MQKLLIVSLLICLSSCYTAKKSDYFEKGKEYHYHALYIDQGDTLTSEKLILKPLGRPWLPQPWLQTAIRYIYHTDTSGYRNIEHPLSTVPSKNIDKKETTGATQKENEFYMHPPRDNQYDMLFYAAHPRIKKRCITDSTTTFTAGIGIPLMGTFWHHYTVTPRGDTIIDSKRIKAWQVETDLDAEIQEEDEKEGIYKSTMDAVYTVEYGFVKMHYTFEDSTKIQFDFEKMVKL